MHASRPTTQPNIIKILERHRSYGAQKDASTDERQADRNIPRAFRSGDINNDNNNNHSNNDMVFFNVKNLC